ncbi:hypothetical protein MWN41_12445, partial [Ornithobacterium rhinotracheale]|uniref:hypothetical protein n=1 Tax=Ornithobacterium rhinotracheale TaxID=28251 RepID=UPI001FF6CFE8
YFHIVNQENSFDIDDETLNNIIDKLNKYYNPHNLYFHQVGVDYINNNLFSKIENYEKAKRLVK